VSPGRLLLVLSFLFGGFVPTLAQCITDLKKILPERAQNISDNFGNSVATANNYVVVSAFQSDTLGTYLGGVAHVFERVGAGWEHIAMLKPSSSSDYLQFGEHVKIDPSGNTIIVVAYGGNNNEGAYVFEKPATGWEDMSESAWFTLDEKSISSLDFNDDGTKLAIGTPYRDGEQYYHGQVSVFNRPPGGWKDIGAPNVVVDNPEPDGYAFGQSVNFLGSDLVVGAPQTADGYGSIFVMKETGSSYTRIARLTSSLPFAQTHFLGGDISVKGDLIVSPAITYINQAAEARR
jgi:hypothetical protein